MKIVAATFALALLAAPAWAQAPAPPAANPEMARMFKEDQADRNGVTVDWKVVKPRDEQRRAATQKMLAEGALHTSEDYKAASFIFQHGGEPNDYLMAHSLAMVAVAKGDPSAMWIASATLDRYLQKIGQKQIYGTQYIMPKTVDAAATQEPYDRSLISDALRKELHVPNTEAQGMQLKVMEQMAKQQLAAAKKP